MTISFRASPGVRFMVRAVVSASLAGLAVAGTIWIDNPWVQIASATVAALAAYMGIGATTPMEPFVGVNKVDVEVPVPPAIPEPAPGAYVPYNPNA